MDKRTYASPQEEFRGGFADIILCSTNLTVCRYGDISIMYAGIVNFKFKDYKAAVEDLSACIEVDDQNKSALTYLVSTQDLTMALGNEA